MSSFKGWIGAGALALTVLGGLTAARPAHACGGLFCSSAMPVNQAAERIVFAFDRPNKKVTAVIEILYDGPSSKFAWVLPVPGIPTVGVSTSALLDRLQAATNPSYGIQRDFGDQCGGRGGATSGNAGSGAPPPSASDPGGKGPSVMVLASGSAGPYDYEVIKVNPAMSDSAAVAIEWLTKNGYDVGALGPDVLRPYLNDGDNLLAFKLSKNKMTGSIRPVMLTYTDDRPMIPIRPTAVAANKDMGILTFVLGSARAVPVNYKTLELNEALIDWFNPNMTYNAVVTAAADEVGGQGFVTELASPSAMNSIAQQLLPEQFQIQQFRQSADKWESHELIAQFVAAFSVGATGNFGGPFGSRPAGGRVALDGVADVLAENLTLPTGVRVEDVLASPRCYFAAFRQPGTFYCDGKPAPTQTIDLATFDRIKFLTSVEKLVIGPLEATVQLFSASAYLTRLYTTMSAPEMTMDPEFDFNNEIGDVSNIHSVTLKYNSGGCGNTNGKWEASVGGLIVRGEGNTWPIDLAKQKMPYNRRVLNITAAGPGEVVADNTSTIARALGGEQPATDSGGGCAVGDAGGANPALLWLAAPFVALLWRRRRR